MLNAKIQYRAFWLLLPFQSGRTNFPAFPALEHRKAARQFCPAMASTSGLQDGLIELQCSARASVQAKATILRAQLSINHRIGVNLQIGNQRNEVYPIAILRCDQQRVLPHYPKSGSHRRMFVRQISGCIMFFLIPVGKRRHRWNGYCVSTKCRLQKVCHMIGVMVQTDHIPVMHLRIASPMLVCHRPGQKPSCHYNNGTRFRHDILRMMVFRRLRKATHGRNTDQVDF